MALKLALLDEIPSDDKKVAAFLMMNYAKPFWLELLVSAYMLPIAVIMTGTGAKAGRAALYGTPAGFFVACLFCASGLYKLGIRSDFWNIWLPDALALICILILGVIMITIPEPKSRT